MTRLLSGLLAILVLGALAAAAEPAPGRTDPFAAYYAPLDPPEIGAEARERIEGGGVVVRPLSGAGSDGIGVEVFGVIDASPAGVWAVMKDCEGQDEFLPRVLAAEVSDEEGERHTCLLVIDLPFPLDDTRAASRNHARRLPDGGYQRHWSLAPGEWSYERNDGSWSIHPWPLEEPEAGRSLLVNRMDMLPRSMIPHWVVRAAQSQQAPDSFEAIRERVRERGETGEEAGDGKRSSRPHTDVTPDP